jgi:hypothetical protein
MKKLWKQRVAGLVLAGAFALPVVLAPQQAQAMSTGEGAGIAVGTAAIGGFLFSRLYKHHRHHKKAETKPAPGTTEPTTAPGGTGTSAAPDTPTPPAPATAAPSQ